MLKSVLSGLFAAKPASVATSSAMVVGQQSRRNDGQGGGDAMAVAATAWLDALLVSFYQSMHRQEKHNFDHDMFVGQDEREFRVQPAVSYLKFLFDNHVLLFKGRARLADEDSRELLDRLILYRLLGHHHVRIVDDVERHWRARDQARAMQVGLSQEQGRFGTLGVFDVPFENLRIRLTGWHINIAASFLLGQYYFDRNGLSVRPEAGDFLIDAGACFGDTALAFAASTGAAGRVYAFDMVPTHCRIIQSNLDANPALATRVRLFPFGLSAVDRNVGLSARDGNGIDPSARLDVDADPVRSTDSLVKEGAIERVDFIKLDVEGSEMDVLIGAEQSLRRWRPRLAISIYHRFEDYFAISDYLAGLNLGYRFFADHYTVYGEETVLYATTDEYRA